MVYSNVSGVNKANTSKDAPKISSMKDIENNPEFFPLWVEELQRKNMGSLISATAMPDETAQSTDESSFMNLAGSSSTGSDMFSGLGGVGSSSSDPMASLFSTQGLGIDMSFMNPASTLQSFEVADTLKGLTDYSNAKETKQWIGQMVSYLDPTDNIVKTGRVTRIDIENVSKPVFRIDDKIDLTLDEIKSFNAESPQANVSAQA